MNDLSNHIFIECKIEVEIASGYQIILNENIIYLPKTDATADGNGVYVTQKLYAEKLSQII